VVLACGSTETIEKSAEADSIDISAVNKLKRVIDGPSICATTQIHINTTRNANPALRDEDGNNLMAI
jgi:hypothetical protein